MKSLFLFVLVLLVLSTACLAQTGGKGEVELSPPGKQSGNINIDGTVSADGAVSALSISLTGSAYAVTHLAKLTATLSPAAVSANTCAEQDFTVTGAAVGDVVFVNKPTSQAGLGVSGARASSADHIAINFCNNTGSPITPTASQSYLFGLIK